MKLRIPLFPLRAISQDYLNSIYLAVVAATVWILSTSALIGLLWYAPGYAGFAAGINTFVLSIVTAILIARSIRGNNLERDLLELKLTTRAIEESTGSILSEVRK
jgi:hypothetical protein